MRPTISLCIICKNELENLPRLLESVRGCFDEIHITDTGSTDGTIELITKLHRENTYETPLFLHHFAWVDDFAAARNFSFSHDTCDYQMWLDCDDVLGEPESFINWRDTIMQICDYWVATYHYAMDANGKPNCSFARERVIKRSLGLKWRYFVHEGIPGIREDGSMVAAQYATSWSVRHLRNGEDMKKDRTRNISLFRKHMDTLDPRMQYYYGKELYENQEPQDAFKWLLKAAAQEKLEMHDRILAIQYGAMAAQQCGQFDKSIQLCHQGLQLTPSRAEFLVMIGDAYVKKNQLVDSIPYYQAARNCVASGGAGGMQAPIYQHEDSYTVYPRNQLARVYVHLGDFGRAREILTELKLRYPNKESEALAREAEALENKVSLDASVVLKKSDDIVISCHPTGFYEWDEEIYREKGIGGSETAVVEMARHLHAKTGRRVLVFNNRTTTKVMAGVEYWPAPKVHDYFSETLPALHVSWRHNQKITNAKTLVWNHDLGFPGLQAHHSYDGVFCLSEFHKNYVSNLFQVPKEKILVTKNGIDPKRFKGLEIAKQAGRVVWSSSPDRGLDRAIRVMDKVRKQIPHATLHVYYGFDNMVKNGLSAQVKELEAMINDRPWITYHGNVEQKLLAQELAKAEVWLYPTNFLETFCITALEMLCCKVFPVARAWGGLSDTLKDAAKLGHAELIDFDCVTPVEIQAWADTVVWAIQNRLWEKIAVNPEDYSWERVAESWLEFLPVTS